MSECCKSCLEEFELITLKSRVGRLNLRRLLLNQLLGKTRYKRGAFNFIGSISKTLVGKLSGGNLDGINYEINQLYAENKISKIHCKVKQIKSQNAKFFVSEKCYNFFSDSDLNLVRTEFLPLKRQINDQELKSAGKSLNEIETVLNKLQSIRQSHFLERKGDDHPILFRIHFTNHYFIIYLL